MVTITAEGDHIGDVNHTRKHTLDERAGGSWTEAGEDGEDVVQGGGVGEADGGGDDVVGEGGGGGSIGTYHRY